MLKSVLILLALTGFGVISHFTDPFVWLLVFGTYIILALCSFAVIVIGLFSKKFRLVYLAGFIPLVVSISLKTGVGAFKRARAIAINSELHKLRDRDGFYPKDLKSVKDKVIVKGYEYSVDPGFRNYTLLYYVDNFNRVYYDSSSDNWGTLGWND